MRFLPAVLLFLCAANASWGTMIREQGPEAVRLNFELCPRWEAIVAEETAGAEFMPMEGASQWGSLTGLVDFGATDVYLRYLDEYVMAIMPAGTLHSVVYGLLPGDPPAINPESVVVVHSADEDYPSL